MTPELLAAESRALNKFSSWRWRGRRKLAGTIWTYEVVAEKNVPYSLSDSEKSERTKRK